MIYDDQMKSMQNILSANVANQGLGGQGMMMPSVTPDILAYEQAIKALPSLPLNAEERGKILAAIQSYYQRKASQYAGPQNNFVP